MDWMQFTASMIGSLAWPIATVIIVAIFRRSLIDRIPALRKLTLPGGVSAEFEDLIAEAEAAQPDDIDSPQKSTEVPGGSADASTASTVDFTAALSHPPAGSDWVHFFARDALSDRQALRANPTGVVMEAWKFLEFAMVEAATLVAPNLDIPRAANFSSLMIVLTSNQVINDKDVDLVRKMREMRNLAAHTDESITEDGAQRYKQLALDVGRRLLEAAAKLSPV